jgi:hypothetical protein
VDVMVDEDDVRGVLQDEVIKRDVLEGDKAMAAAKQVARAGGRALRKSSDKDGGDDEAEPVVPPAAPV